MAVEAVEDRHELRRPAIFEQAGQLIEFPTDRRDEARRLHAAETISATQPVRTVAGVRDPETGDLDLAKSVLSEDFVHRVRGAVQMYGGRLSES